VLQAQAQTRYSCKDASGRYVQQHTPCNGNPGGMVQYGAEEPKTNTSSNSGFQRPAERPADPAPFVRYLSARCASLNDALRTAASRRIPYDKIYDMRRDYTGACQEEEAEARDQANQAMREKRQEQLLEKRVVAAEARQEQDRSTTKVLQCAESKRILANKKARTDLTDGEKADLARFESNVQARCS
jgi:hypothetical protein